MLINLHNLTHIPVVTESGEKLGRVYDINFDIDTQCVKSYVVKKHMLSTPKLIKPEQVLSISKDKIIVEDALIKDKEKVKAIKKEKPVGPAGVTLTEGNRCDSNNG